MASTMIIQNELNEKDNTLTNLYGVTTTDTIAATMAATGNMDTTATTTANMDTTATTTATTTLSSKKRKFGLILLISGLACIVLSGVGMLLKKILKIKEDSRIEAIIIFMIFIAIILLIARLFINV
jgi:hypothetical protein